MWLHRRARDLLLILLVGAGVVLPGRGAAAASRVAPSPCPGVPIPVTATTSGSLVSSPLNPTDVAGRLAFVTRDVTNGTRLWWTDVTATGAAPVKGWAYSETLWHLTAVGSTLFFTVATGGNTELWKSDGTVAGTQQLKVLTGQNTISFGMFAAVGSTLFFSADDESLGLGQELWKSDGSSLGTGLVKDIQGGGSGSFPSGLTAFNGQVFFTADDGSRGLELWKSDGTKDGTNLVKDIWIGGGSAPDFLRVMGQELYFTATDGSGNATLWKSDGTDMGTVAVVNSVFGATHGGPQDLTVVGNTLFFWISTGTYGDELWKSDGTEAGTAIVRDIGPQETGSTPQQLTAVGHLLFFMATDGQTGLELWRSDGTAAGTQLVRDSVAGSQGPLTHELTPGPGALLARMSDGSTFDELWKVDGADVTSLLDVSSGSGHSAPSDWTLAGNTLFFAARDSGNAVRLFALPLNQVDCVEPVLRCPSAQRVAAVSSQGAFFTVPPVTAVDDSLAEPVVTSDRPLAGLFPLGSTDVHIWATDAAGNSAPCTVTVSVEDMTPPRLVCPATVKREATGPDGAVVTYFVVASDDVAPAVHLDIPSPSGITYPLGTRTLHITGTDDSQNSASCDIQLSVTDTTPPRLTCPPDVVRQAVSLDPITVDYTYSVEDAVTAAPGVSADHPSGSQFPVGDTQVTLTAMDDAHNTSQCSFWVRNVDSEAPTITCPGPQQVVASKDEGAKVSFPGATATDNLGAPTVSYSQDPGTTFALGETTVTATATDAGGNQASCTFTVTVLPGGDSSSCQAGPSGVVGWWLLLALTPLWARRRARGGAR